MKNRFIIAVLVAFLLAIVPSSLVMAQGCPMCKRSLESAQQSGGKPYGRKINSAILFLLCAPFAAIGTVGSVFYYRSRKLQA